MRHSFPGHLLAQNRCETIEHNNSRTEQRTYTALGGPGFCEWVMAPTLWSGLRNLIRVRTEHNSPRGR